MTKDTEDQDRVEEGSDDSAVDLEAVLGGDDDDAAEAALDLSDLDELGVDGLVAQLRGGDADPTQDADDVAAAGIGTSARPPRSPIISAIVLSVAAYLLISMFADFRYWLRSDEPVDLGEASSLVERGALSSGDYHDTYVVLRGTPDVQHAARLTTKANYVGYLRITEGSGGLFAALPRSKEDKTYNTFEGRYQGRMTRLGSDRAFPWLEQFFGNEKLTEPVDQSIEAWFSALAQAGGGAVSIGEVEIAADEQIRLVSDTPDVRLQLGRSSFTAKGAEQAVAALGYAWLAQEPTDTFYRYVARIPEAERESARALLEEDATGESANPADPAIGVVALPLRLTYVASVGSVEALDGALRFPIGDNTTARGYDAAAGKLIERATEGAIEIASSSLRAIRYERPIVVDPDGYIIEVGADPASERMAGILWLVVFGIASVNVFSILLWLRRRAA